MHACPRSLKLLLTGFMVVASLQAQTAAPPVATPEKPAEEVVQLSVFEVSSKRDVGYRAVTTLAGTRTGEEVKDVPQVITVLTSEFIKDVGAIDAFGVMQYATGAAYRPSSSFDVNTFQFRGMDNAFQSRNFFLWYMPSDGFSTDRIDIVRGPNAILFGDSDPGGMLNIETKRAMWTDASSIAMRVGSWEQYRTTLDLNRVLHKKLAVRLNLLWDEKQSWENWVGQERRGVQMAITYTPWDGARLSAEAEHSMQERRVAQTIPLDAYTEWNGTTPFTFNAASGPAGTQRLSSATGANYWAWDAGTGTMTNWRGFGQTNRALSNSDAVKDTAIYAKGAHFVGPDWRHDFEYHALTLNFEQQIGKDLTLGLIGNVTSDTNYRTQSAEDVTVRRDPNATLPGGAVNPHFGDYYLEYQWQQQRVHHFIPEARFNLVYDWRLTDWMKQRLFFNLTYQNQTTVNRINREVIVNNPAESRVNQATNQVRRRVYLSGGDGADNVSGSGAIADPATGLRSEFRNTQAAARNNNPLGVAQVSASGEYWDGKVRTLLGVRRDNLRAYTQQGVRDPVTGENVLANGVNSLRFQGWNTSLTYGGIWQPRSEVTFFANHGESFRPLGFGATLLDNSPVGSRLGRGLEGGVRFDLRDGKFYVQASAYDITQTNRVYTLATAVTTAINTLWGAVDASKQVTGTADRQNLATQGYEIEAWMNLVPGWTLTAGWGWSDARVSSIADYTRSYLTENTPVWKSYVAANPSSAGQLNPQLATLDNFMATVVPGTRPEGSYRQSFSLFTKYIVPSGRLKNLSVGLGASYNSGSVRYNTVAAGVVTPVYGESSAVLNALIGYERRLNAKVRWSIGLNIQNLLDREYLLETSRTQVTYAEPRTWSLTNTFSF